MKTGRIGWRRLRALWRWLDLELARRFALSTPEDRRFFLLIPGVGLAVGLVSILVERASELLRALLWGGFFPSFEFAVGQSPPWRPVLALGLGGVGIWLLTLLARSPLSRQGVSAVVEAVAVSGGRLPVRPVLFSAGASLLTVSSGGSLGREGPMVRLGAALASWAGQKLGLPGYRLKILLGCGTAAAFAANFNVPIGASLFALEVVLGTFALEVFGPIVVSAAVATLLARAAESEAPIYPAPGYALETPWELLFHFGLGLLGAAAAVAFVLAEKASARLFRQSVRIPEGFRPLVGLLLVASLGLLAPEVLGNGFSTITSALQEQYPLQLLAVLAVLKLMATALTSGSGAPGGHFTPSLCFGALVGGAYGELVHALAPDSTSGSGAYAAVGMAAVAAGTSHAPLSASLMLFELTGNYTLILPLMVAATVSSAVARKIYPYSIHTEPLQRKGIDLSHRLRDATLSRLTVRDLIREDRETLSPATAYPQIVERFLATRRQRLFVVDGDRLVGAVSLHDIKHALRDSGSLALVLAHDLLVPVSECLDPDDRLDRAAEFLTRSDYERVPVRDREGRYLGVLVKRDVLALYAQEVLGRRSVLTTYAASGEEGVRAVELPPNFSLRLVRAPAELLDRALAELRLTQEMGVRVVEISRQRGELREWVVPEASTVVEPGDELLVLGPQAAVEALAAGRLPKLERPRGSGEDHA